MILHLTQEDFHQTLENNPMVVVDFWAKWCMPCKMMQPVLKQLDETFGKSIVIGKADVDELPQLADQYQIHSIPALVIFAKGEVVSTIIGVRPYTQIVDEVQKQLDAQTAQQTAAEKEDRPAEAEEPILMSDEK